MKNKKIKTYDELLKAYKDTRAFHIHIDCHEEEPSQEFLKWLFQRDYVYRNFMNLPDDVNYEPTIHITAFYKELQVFKKEIAALMQYVTNNPKCMNGYIESESVIKIPIVEKKFIELPIPLRCTFKEKIESFRENELHITYNRDKSSTKVGKLLKSMGFHKALMEKKDKNDNILFVKEIWTIQGTNKQIQSILPTMVIWLNQLGGIVGGSIKEEIVYKSWTSSKTVELPRQIENIEFS